MREVEGVQVDLDVITESLPKPMVYLFVLGYLSPLECTLAGLVLQGAHHLAKWVPTVID